MGVLFLLECLCFFIVCLANGTAGLTLPLNQALDSPISLATVTTNLSGSTAGELCTSSLIWAGGTVYDTEFTNNCFQAWRTFLTTDNAMQRGVDYEFSQQGLAPSHPGLPSMATPRRYVKESCTIAIANIADIPRGILPFEPPGPFPRSDVAKFLDFRGPMVAVRAGCLGRNKKVGWAPVGRLQSIAVLMFSTSAPIDRMIPRGVIPSNLLNASTVAVGGLVTAA